MPALVNRVATIPDGDIPIGNDVVRDYLHIDDVVRAYLALASRGSPGEVYNVASGAGISVREIATEALRRAGKSGRVTSDPSLQRTADMPVLIGSSAKLQRDTGWRPTRPWQDILDDLMTHR
jgi:GDP-4-dehydro-6-deoxy-D-mannose reductase